MLENDWFKGECEWRSRHESSFDDCLGLTNKIYELHALLQRHEDIMRNIDRDDVVLVWHLMRRLCEELRTVEVLAVRGHGFQAASLASSLFERAHVLIYVSDSDEAALEFLTWNNPYKPFKSVWQLVKETAKMLNWTEQRRKKEYHRYQFLCSFKHNNPVAQTIYAHANPNVFLGRFSLCESMWMVLVALAWVSTSHMKTASSEMILGITSSLLSDVKGLFPEAPDFEGEYYLHTLFEDWSR